MTDFGLPETSRQMIADLLRRYAQIESAVVFGSRALGTYKPGSDVDIALMGAGVTPMLALDISAQLNERLPLPWFFDVLDYGGISYEPLKAHIDAYGKLFFSRTDGE